MPSLRCWEGLLLPTWQQTGPRRAPPLMAPHGSPGQALVPLSSTNQIGSSATAAWHTPSTGLLGKRGRERKQQSPHCGKEQKERYSNGGHGRGGQQAVCALKGIWLSQVSIPATRPTGTSHPQVCLRSLLHRFPSFIRPPLTLASTPQEPLASCKGPHSRSVHFTGYYALSETTVEPRVQESH